MSELLENIENQVIEDIAGNVVEHNVVTEGKWCEIETKDLCEMFGDYVLYADEQFEEQYNNQQFDYEIFNKQYYSEKFPGFDDDVHEVLADVSRRKIIDLRKLNDTFQIKQGEFDPFEEDRQDKTNE